MKKIGIIVYIMSTIIKLFTAQIGFDAETGPMIVIKSTPTIGNIYYTDADIHNKSLKFKGNFYKVYTADKYLFWIILYDILILLWWCSSIFIIFRKIIKIVCATSQNDAAI